MTGRLRAADEHVIGQARELAALHGSGAVSRHTGEAGTTLAYAVTLGEAQYYLRELARIIERLAGDPGGLADEEGPDSGEGAAVHGLSCGCPECDNDEDEPYCVTCGADVGIFIGHGDAWLHYTGQGTVASPVELYDAGHAPEVAWRPAGAR